MDALACAPASIWSEEAFRQRVDALNGQPHATTELIALLHERHPGYAQRSAGAIARMRGWVLLTLANQQLPADAHIYVLEELDNGRHAYLVAAAARALQSSASPHPAMATFLMRAITNIRDHDDLVDLTQYGGVGDSPTATTAFAELLAALRWLGAAAAPALVDLNEMAQDPTRRFSPAQRQNIDNTIACIKAAGGAVTDCCALPSWLVDARRVITGAPANLGSIEFEDQEGRRVAFDEFFNGQPAVVVFFYSRCDNPQKCSLTVTKLARVQTILAAEKCVGRIRTAAITYDPGYDTADRLLAYANSRGVQLDADNRMLRATAGMDALHQHFQLGVSFIGSLVNRHRVEAFIVGADGTVKARFTRIGWDESILAAQVMAILREPTQTVVTASVHDKTSRASNTSSIAVNSGTRCKATTGPLLSLALALFPKCPLCGATYLSLSGIIAMPQLPAFYWLFPLMLALVIVNLGSIWYQAHRRRRYLSFVIAALGTALLVGPGLALEIPYALGAGIALVMAGSLIGITQMEKPFANVRSI